MTTKSTNYITDAWAASAVPRIQKTMEARDVKEVTTFDVLHALMQHFNLDLRFDFFVKIAPMQDDLEASFAALGFHRSGSAWSFGKPASSRARKAPAHKPA